MGTVKHTGEHQFVRQELSTNVFAPGPGKV